MKNYVIHCNEEQLQRIRSALELQMRVRIGQGWAITENITDICDKDYVFYKDAYDRILDDILTKIVCDDQHRLKKGKDWTDRDMWIGCENALGIRVGEIALSEYGIMKVEEVSE